MTAVTTGDKYDLAGQIVQITHVHLLKLDYRHCYYSQASGNTGCYLSIVVKQGDSIAKFMDIIAGLAMANNNPPPVDILAKEAPIPVGSSRFILPIDLQQALSRHLLTRDLYPIAAGLYIKDIRRYHCMPPASPLIYYCVGGKMNLLVEDNSFPVISGDLIIIPPKLAHITAASECSYFWVSYSGELRAAYTQFINAADMVVHLGLDPELIAQFEALCNLRTSDFTLDTFINGANRLKVLLTSISLTLSDRKDCNKGRIDLDRIRNLMMECLASTLNLQELADRANMSPFHFARTFKKQTGQSPMRYFTQLRLQHACHLLDTTRQPINQIAAAVGYRDPLYFSRIFRQIIGMSPSSYRKWSVFI